MSTYKTASAWQKSSSSKGYKSGDAYYRQRRKVLTYRHGNEYPIDTEWEYKGLITQKEKPLPAVTDTQPVLPPSGDLTAPDFTGPQGVQYRRLPDGTYVEIGGVGDGTSAKNALLEAYTTYLDRVTYYNNDLKAKLELHYDLLAAKQGMKYYERDAAVMKEFNRQKIARLSYAEWLLRSEQGTIQDPSILYGPPPLEEEVDATRAQEITNVLLEAVHKGPIGMAKTGLSAALTSKKWVKGAKYGWDLADATGLTRIAAMGMAGMPPYMVASMAMSTATYGMAGRMAGQQDVLTAGLSNLYDKVDSISNQLAGTNVVTGENYKQMYLRLNDHAKRQGIIKGDWQLRLSRNIPVKERWRRLYVTLAAHIEKKKQVRKPQRKTN